MPQMNKGGKFIFGKSLIRTDGTLRIPPQAMEEYHIADEGKVYLFTGSKITGGFCVTRKGLLHPSKLGHILDDTPPLLATVYKGNIIKNLIMDCQSYTKYRPNETTGGIFVSWRRKEELPTGA